MVIIHRLFWRNLRNKLMSERIVVTGIGVITSIGIGKDNFWNAMMKGECGVKQISRFDIADYPTKIAAEILDFNPQEYMDQGTESRCSRWNQLGIAATRMAIEDSTLDLSVISPERIGISIGVGGEAFALVDERTSVAKGKYTARMDLPDVPNLTSSLLADEFSIMGPSMCIATACSAGNMAVGQARDLIRLGKVDVMITGGAEAPIFPLGFASFCALRVMSKRNEDPKGSSRPFDLQRDGFVLGEGSAMMILERESSALERGARIYAELAGFGATCDAYHMTMPAPDKVQIARAMELALVDGGSLPERIDYINAHGTSTEANDIGETRAIKSIFGERAYQIPVSSIKSMIGHTLGAAGAIELISTILAIERGFVPPTINQEVPDPQCDLDYVPNESREHIVNEALSNSFGFGGNNSSILVRKVNQDQ
jgi:3-oxoacyl-[acyl-carrier-protein] synthase II